MLDMCDITVCLLSLLVDCSIRVFRSFAVILCLQLPGFCPKELPDA